MSKPDDNSPALESALADVCALLADPTMDAVVAQAHLMARVLRVDYLTALAVVQARRSALNLSA